MSLRDEPIQDELPEIVLAGSPSDSVGVVPPGKLELVPNWTVSRVVELIQQYKKRPILWNCSGRGSWFRESAQSAWMSLGKEMCISPAECRRKISVLVTQFNREYRKEEMMAADGYKYTSAWLPYFHLEFLKTKRMRKGWKKQNHLQAPVQLGNNQERNHQVVHRRSEVSHDHASYHQAEVVSFSDQSRGKSYQSKMISGNENQDPLDIQSGSGKTEVVELLDCPEGVRTEIVIHPNDHEDTNMEELTNIEGNMNIEEDTVIGEDILSSFGLDGVDFGSAEELEGLMYPREIKFTGSQQTVPYVGDVKPDVGDVKQDLVDVKPNLVDVKPKLGDVKRETIDLKPVLGDMGSELVVKKPKRDGMKPELDYMKPEQSDTKLDMGAVERDLGDKEPELGDEEPELGAMGPQLGDSCGVFGAYVAAKLRHLTSDSARDKVECLLSNLLYAASAGTLDRMTTSDISMSST